MVTALSSAQHLNVLSELQKTSQQQKKSFNELSSGKKAGTESLVKIGALESAIRGTDVGSSNAASASSTISIASGGLQQTLNNLQNLRELAVQASGNTLSSADRQNISLKAQDTLNSINDTARSTTANGSALLDGSYGSKTTQVGANAGDTATVSIAGARTEDLGVNTVDLSTSDGASSAIESIDAAITSVASQMSTLGSKQSSLETTVTTNNTSNRNIQEAKSQLEDLDYAHAVGQIQAQKIKQQAQVQTLALLQTKDQSSLKLLA